MDDDPECNDGSHPQPKKSRLSTDHSSPEASPSTAPGLDNNSPTEVAGRDTEPNLCVDQPKPNISSNEVSMEIEVATSSTAPQACSADSMEAVNVVDLPSRDAEAEPEPEVETVAAAGPLEPAPAEERSSEPSVRVRSRNRFRNRSYRLRSDSSSSEREGNAADDDTNNEPDVEAMIRRLVDEMNRESNGDSDNGEEGSQQNDENSSADTSSNDSEDSDDSDTSPTVSFDGDDDDDSEDSSVNEGGSENNINAPVDVSNLPFMQTANLKSTWDFFREIQLRSMGLSYRPKASTGGVRYDSQQFQSHAYGSKHVVERLALTHRLRKHNGCVNSLNFNSTGMLLASGSDDLKINLWHWQTNKLAQTISSGHRSNVFQTKFAEASGYRNEIEIISTGRDGQVRHTRVGPAGDVKRSVLFKQNQPIHKIAIPARCQYEFLTACEDGVVKSYDLRDNITKKVTSTKKQLYSISTHPLDNEFCVSGRDEQILVYDRRQTSRPAKKFYATHMKPASANRKGSITVTCAVYNATGTEILASYSDEDIYLFDNVTGEEGKYLHKYSGHCNIKTIKGVNFFGPQSEFVVSGSDCGNIFIWDKETEIIVNWLKGDDAGVVNCLEPHPEFPIMATSGLDHDTKIWIPIGTDDEHEAPVFSREALEKCVRRNFRIRQTSRYPSYSENRILDFLMLSRPGIGGRLRRRFSSDSDGQADGDGNGNNAEGGRRGNGDDDDDDSRMILRCNPS